jgi:anti-sigma factor RsiW
MTELITDYLEGRLPVGDRLRFQFHLGTCTYCRAYLKQMRQTLATLGKLPEEPIPEDVQQELLRRFRSWKRS